MHFLKEVLSFRIGSGTFEDKVSDVFHNPDRDTGGGEAEEERRNSPLKAPDLSSMFDAFVRVFLMLFPKI